MLLKILSGKGGDKEVDSDDILSYSMDVGVIHLISVPSNFY